MCIDSRARPSRKFFALSLLTVLLALPLDGFASFSKSKKHKPQEEERVPRVECKIGDEKAKPGPGYNAFAPRRVEPSSTIATIQLGNYWERGFYSYATSEQFQYGHEFTAEELRKMLQIGDEVTDGEILRKQRENPSARDYIVTGQLENSTIRMKISWRDNPFNIAAGHVIGDEKHQLEIDVEQESFGKWNEHPMGVKIHCTGRLR